MRCLFSFFLLLVLLCFFLFVGLFWTGAISGYKYTFWWNYWGLTLSFSSSFSILSDSLFSCSAFFSVSTSLPSLTSGLQFDMEWETNGMQKKKHCQNRFDWPWYEVCVQIHLLWFRQMCVQVQFGANFIPIREASFLDAWNVSNQIRARFSDVIS